MEYKEKYFISYYDKDFEIPYKYYKKVRKLLKILPAYISKGCWGYYKLKITDEEYAEFLKFKDYNKQCLKNNVDFENQTKYFVEDSMKIREVSIDEFNKYKKCQTYILKFVDGGWDIGKVVLIN